MRYERVVSISHDHPSLAGHFPGHPIVPGVVLLNEVLDTLRQYSSPSLAVMGFPSVKFSSPLRPGEVVTIRVEADASALATFFCRVESRLIAIGSIELSQGTAAERERV